MFYLALLLYAILVQAQAQVLIPDEGSPTGCLSQLSGNYEATIVKPIANAANNPSKRSFECGTNALVLSLTNGVLTDSKGRIGSILANRQLEFDGPPAKVGAIFTGGFSFCPNTSIALGPTTNFFQCLSGDSFNLYDQPVGSNCSYVNIQVMPCSFVSSTVSNGDTSSSSSTSTPSSTSVSTGGSASATISTSSVSDLLESSSSSSTTFTTSMKVSSGTNSMPSNGTNLTSTPPTLSDSAKIGVGIVVGIAAVLGFSLAAFMFGRRQSKMRIVIDKGPGVAVDGEPGVAVN